MPLDLVPFALTPASPYRNVVVVTPADGADLAVVAQGISCTVAGVVKVTDYGGNTSLIPIPAGIITPIIVKRIWSTTTTATGIVAYYN